MFNRTDVKFNKENANLIRALLLLPLLLLLTQPAIAIRQGTATAEIFIKHYVHTEDFGKLALWHETAAECLARISRPMNQIAHDYYKQHGHKKWVTRSKKEARQIQEQYQYHRKRAKTAWQKSETPEPVLNAERENIAKFIAMWMPRYPNRFYEFGIYPTFFRKQREFAEQAGDYRKALQLEADAAAMCAAQYEKIPIAYGIKRYEKHRDIYRQYALLLQNLAQQNPQKLPSEVNAAKQIAHSLETQTVSTPQKADLIQHIAASDLRVKTALKDQTSVHAYPSFHGFAWIVHFANHSRGNIVTAIIDEKTTNILAVFYSRIEN